MLKQTRMCLVGAGQIGSMHVLLAQLSEAERVIVSVLIPARPVPQAQDKALELSWQLASYWKRFRLSILARLGTSFA
jgi:hypothetical protein